MRLAVAIVLTIIIKLCLAGDVAPPAVAAANDESPTSAETTARPTRRRPTASSVPRPKVIFDEYEPKKNGDYAHEIEFDNGIRHKEEGKFMKGEYHFRGFFYDKAEPNKFHIYVKDASGFHYYPYSIKGNGTQEYGVGEEDEDICSQTSNSCIDARVMASLLGG